MAKIVGIEGLSMAQLQQELSQGGKFVVFSWVVSVLVMTFKRPSAIHYIRPGESAVAKALPYIAISATCGWWGIPFGFIFTPWSIIENLTGGKDVTAQMMSVLAPAGAGAPMPVAAAPASPLTPR
ncbi:MAG TPA: hypothetical protein VMV18_10825 [bacterium]|nr:hypothetical protein [bacterium]